ncbi:peroxin 13 putative (PEX13) [Leptomonas pyrrhocoris]|uniref:Peroxin 13 putative (PEX13) n=1 Tax=Leptomonas pyrrhocoris TaxID=157538 RepID=A0A0N0DX61_LEPPY|nr:peroxin 13 putative (PEX13) [Leptomonas pyrrhocoris]KPA82608.1 peroxin 13 putative (PEX13) [Leptomonas pyrrhocoris]|eukprot:XP_015661047.1 peroxin 13 putative (PEX13) [Leptomonas pyrrhocoris]
MYGGMYGGGLGMGGMGGMGGMYGGGLGMGGLGSGMYGGGYGMGSSMYGGGLGMGGGMYGGSGLTGGSSYGMNGGLSGFGRNNQLGSSNGMGMGNGLNNDGMQGNGMQSPLNLPPTDQSNQLASPINQNSSPLPPLNESPEERSRRIQAEHKKERQLIRQQREQHRQARLQARMEIAGHFTNILVQGLRSAMELFGVCFGTYYSMKAVRAFSSVQPNMGMMPNQRFAGNLAQQQQQAAATAAATKTQQAAANAGTAGPSRWRTWLLCIALFILGEVAYSIATRQRAKPPQRRRRITGPTEDAYGNVISPDEYEVSIRSTDDESDLTENEREEESMSDAWGQAYNSNGVYGGPQGIRPGAGNGVRRVYCALYDYQAPQADGSCLSFKAGDEFIVEDYVEGSWCEAMAVAGGNYSSHGRRGLVPSNFLRLAERATKL